MRIISAIAQIHFQVWIGGASRALGSRRTARSMLILSLALLALWVVFGTLKLSRVRLDFTTGTYSLVHPLVVILFGLPAMMTVFVAMYSVSDSLVENMLVVLPIRRRDRRIAAGWMAIILSTGLSVSVIVPLIIQVACSFPPGTGLAVITCCALIAFIGGAGALMIYEAIQLVVVTLLGDGQTTKVLSGSVSSALIAWLVFRALPRLGDPYGSGPIAVLSAPLRWITDRSDTSVPASLSAVSAYIGMVLTATVSLRVLNSIPPRRLVRPSRFTGRLVPLSARSMLGLEIRQWLRFPANATTLLFVQIMTLALTLGWGSRWSPDEWSATAYLLLALASTIGVGSFGATCSHHWIYRVARQPLRWALPKLGSVLILWACLIAEILLLLFALTSWRGSGLFDLFVMCVTVVLAGCVVGILLPVNRDQTLGGAISASVSIILVMAVSWALQSLPRFDPDAALTSLLMHIGGSAVLVLGYFLLARASAHQDRV